MHTCSVIERQVETDVATLASRIRPYRRSPTLKCVTSDLDYLSHYHN